MENAKIPLVETALALAYKLRNNHKYIGVVYCYLSQTFCIDTAPGVRLQKWETVVVEYIKGKRAYGFPSDVELIHEFSNIKTEKND